MKRYVIICLFIYTFVSSTFQLIATTCCQTNSTGIQSITPKFTIRSQGTNAARRIIGSINHINTYDMEQLYGTISVTPEYTRSFNTKKIAECLFGNKLCDGRILRIQGSRVENRDKNALLADYFYLPTDFSSEIIVRPLIQNFIFDLNLFLGLDNIYKGFYFWIQSPIVWSRWRLDLNECIKDKGKNNHDEGYFTINTLKREHLLDNFSEYANGSTIGTNGIFKEIASKKGIDQEVSFTFNGLNCAKICKDSRTKTSLSEVRLALGWNFLLEEDYHLGINLQASAPTGNNVKPDFLFDVQNGNDNHWELGGGLTFHYIIKRNKEEDKHFGFYFDANITHMFKNCQKRCFDLCEKPLSRYMLATKIKDIQSANSDNLKGEGTAAHYQFNNVFTPVANLTTFDIDVSVGVNADIVAMINYSGDDWTWDFGYNLWARSCEKIDLKKNCTPFEENTWTLKGDAHVFGFMNANDTGGTTGLLADDFVALSASMSKAEICGGKNFGTKGTITSSAIATAKQNPNIDNAKNATAGSTDVQLDSDRTAENQIKTSIQPIFIKQDDVNFARTKGLSHKLFTHISYTWPNKENWFPYFGTGFEIEWAAHVNNTCDNKTECCTNSSDTNCNTKTNGSCVRCGISQWGYWLKVGLSFD